MCMRNAHRNCSIHVFQAKYTSDLYKLLLLAQNQLNNERFKDPKRKRCKQTGSERRKSVNSIAIVMIVINVFLWHIDMNIFRIAMFS